MTKREKLLMAAVAGIALGASAAPAVAADKDEVKCWGINGCGSHAKCGVTQADLDAFKTLLGQDYEKLYGKSAVHSCGSHAKCGGEFKILNWVPAAPGECKAKGGFVVEEKDGKKVARKA